MALSATAHGKGACDGIGGTVKRLAARASLQKPYSDQIMTHANCLTGHLPTSQLFILAIAAWLTMK